MMNLIDKHYDEFKRLLIIDNESQSNSKTLEDLFHDAILKAVAVPDITTKEDLFKYIKQQMIITRFRDKKIDNLKIPVEYAFAQTIEKQAA